MYDERVDLYKQLKEKLNTKIHADEEELIDIALQKGIDLDRYKNSE